MNKLITLINPQLVTQYGDYLGSGIAYLPLTLAYVASVLKKKYSLTVIDAFGENPFNLFIENRLIIQGLSFDEINEKVHASSHLVVIYFNSVASNYIINTIIKNIKKKHPDMPVAVIENSQGVIGCSLEYMYQEIFKSGADYIILGESEERIVKLLKAIESKKMRAFKDIDGLIYKDTSKNIIVQKKETYIENLDHLPCPAWEYFPLPNYWKLNYSHGPMENNFLALLTSRGCPFKCNFCVVPSMNGRKWRPRSAENVVSEITYLQEKFKVSEFHWEDLNPTANEKRILEICELIIKNRLKIKWKLVSGSKIETMKIDTLNKMKQAGCTYISYSPESGSSRVLKLMNKPFDHEYALHMQKRMKQIGIFSQACFVLGFPGENDEDRFKTRDYVKKLVKAGVDEIALFIMTPIPGTKTFGSLSGYTDYSELTFSPSWRDDYKELSAFRNKLYFYFLFLKILYHPQKVIIHLVNLIRKSFKIKIEMNIYRIIKLKFMLIKDKKSD